MNNARQYAQNVKETMYYVTLGNQVMGPMRIIDINVKSAAMLGGLMA